MNYVNDILSWLSVLDPDTKNSFLALCVCSSAVFFTFGWIFAADNSRRARRAMAMLTLCFPATFVLSPLIVAAFLAYMALMLTAWLVETAARTDSE